jgi:hypothetical protein
MTVRNHRAIVVLLGVTLQLGGLGYAVYVFTRHLPAPRREVEVSVSAATARSAVHLPEPVPEAGSNVTRFTICQQLTAAASVCQLEQLIAVDCGGTLQLLGFDPAGPRLVASARGQLVQPDLHWRSGPIIAADIDGDGLRDLLFGSSYWDSTNAPRGGGLHLLTRTRAGGFAAPRKLSALTLGALAVGHFTAADGVDIAALHRDDNRIGRQDELVTLHGGPAPLQLAAARRPEGVRRLDAIDVNLDGRDELIATFEAAAPEIWYLDLHGQLERRAALELTGVQSVRIADLNADSHADAIFAGAELNVLFAAPDHDGRTQILASGFALESIVVSDLDADGRRDLVGIHEGDIVALMQREPLRFEPKTLASLAQSELQVSDIVMLRAGAVPNQLALFGHHAQRPSALELTLISLTAAAEPLRWTSASLTLPSAPLLLTWSLP